MNIEIKNYVDYVFAYAVVNSRGQIVKVCKTRQEARGNRIPFVETIVKLKGFGVVR